jgi:hypothetical protein
LLHVLLTRLHKVHLAYRMVNVGWASSYTVPTLCNQHLSHF